MDGKKVPKPTVGDLRLAAAIGQAVQESIGPKCDEIRTELQEIKGTLHEHGKKLDDHGKKLDQLVAGAIGVGRMIALEERVAALEKGR